MNTAPRRHFEHRWTAGLVAVMTLTNLGLWLAEPIWHSALELMQFDRDAILSGEVWRLVTGNLVHWSAEHFMLDIAAFAILGWLYEPPIRRYFESSHCELRQLCSMPALILVMSCSVGLAVLFLQPEMLTYRGLSGIDSGLFAAALIIEIREAKLDPARWWFVLPALVVFIVKLVFEVVTGGLFFGTDSLGDLGQPVPLAHLIGAVSATGFLAAGGFTRLYSVARTSTDVLHSSQHAAGIDFDRV